MGWVMTEHQLINESQGAGDAASDTAIRRVIATLGFEAAADIAFERVMAGITNHNWLLVANGQRYFVKFYGEKTSIFINRTVSSEASRLAGDLGIAPRLVAHFADLEAEVYEYLEGYRPVTTEDMQQLSVRDALIAHYRAMHAAPLIGANCTGLEQLATRVSLAREHGATLPEDVDDLLAGCARVEALVSAAETILAPCHNDSYAANFMINDAGDVRIIDWEYAANNDPAWDLAMMSMSLDGGIHTASIVEAYIGAPSPAFADRIIAYGPVIAISWGFWAALQARISTIDFDYAGYSATLFGYGRMMLANPAWEATLCRL
jgi:thiamine kinase-like enzyme